MRAVQGKSKVAAVSGALCVGLLLCFALVPSTPLLADSQGQRLTQHRRTLTSLKTTEAGIQDEMRALRRELLERATEIQKWKQAQASTFNPFIQYRLRSLMQSAHDLAKQMNKLERKKQVVNKKIHSTISLLAKGLDTHMEDIAGNLAASRAGTPKQQQLSKNLQLLHQERKQLILRKSATPPTMNRHAMPTEEDSLDELKEKAAFLHDLQDRIEKNIKTVRERLVGAKRQQLVFEEARHLLDEEAFFSETSFAKNEPAQEADNNEELEGGNALDAKVGEEQDNNDPTANVGSEPGNQDPNNGDPQENPGNGTEATMDGQEPSTDPTITDVAEPGIDGPSAADLAPTVENTIGRNTFGLETTRGLDIDRAGGKTNSATTSFPETVPGLEMAENSLNRQLEKTTGNLKKILALIQILEGVEKTSASKP